MNRLAKSPTSTVKARNLRRQSTPAEMKMWALLRDRRLLGCKFRRQQPIGPYVVDFYSSVLKLAVELDGSGHMRTDRISLGEERSRFLAENGVRVIRFWNTDVTKNVNAVLEQILKVANLTE